MMTHCFITLADYRPKDVCWLWPGRIPYGSITVIEGDPGTNKTTLSYNIVANVTTGNPMYGCTGSQEPGTAILLQAEDALDAASRNIKAAGADLARVFVYEKGSVSIGKPLELPNDLEFVASEVAATKARLVVIDPISAFFAVNLNNDQAVRRALQPLAQLAEDNCTAVVLIRHLTKSGSTNPLYRGAGSIGLVAAARSTLLVAPDPGDLEHRVVAQVKSSLSALSSSLSFRPVARDGGLAVEWLGASDYSARQLLDAMRSGSRSELGQAIYALYSILAEGPVSASEAKALATQAGVSARTLRRAKEVLNVESKRRGFGKGSRFFWLLPKKHEIVARLRKRDLDELEDRLCHGQDPQGFGGGADGGPPDHQSMDGRASERPDDDDPDTFTTPTGE